MARYKIQIVFSGNPNDLDTLDITVQGSSVFEFTFQVPGTGTFNPVNIATPFQATVYNLSEAFRVYYNLSGIYQTSKGADIFDIEGEFADIPVAATTPTNVVVNVTLVADPIAITNLVYQTNGTSPCSLVDLVITADNPFDETISPIAETFADTTTHTMVGVSRGQFLKVGIRDSNGQTDYANTNSPSVLNTGNISLEVLNNSVVVSDTTSGLTLEYSLDDANWQTSNIFNNLIAQTYTLYVRDQLGCKINTQFTITEADDGVIEIPDPYFFYSKANPLRVADRLGQWDDVSIFHNNTNSLSCESREDVVYSEKHRYKSVDVIPLQVKNNYDDLQIITTDDQAVQTLTKVSNNIGNKLSQDCKVVEIGTSTFGIYFISGKTYNYDTGADLLDDYVLNGKLPPYGKIGQRITINNIAYTVEDITFNEDVDAEQLVISSSSLSGVTDAIVKAIYNIYDYEVYECLISCAGREEFSVEFWYNGILQKKSELVLVDDVSENLVHIAWSMNFNTDFIYSSGIQPFARIPVDTIKAGIKNEGETYETDTDAILIDSNNYELDTVTFLPVTKEMARKLILWLSSQELTIQGVGYTKEGVELEPLERSNLYVVTATLVLRGSGLFEDRVSTATQEIVELIKTDSDDFIKTA
jgi:hypothetical protein